MRLSDETNSINVADEHGIELPIEETGWSSVAQARQRLLDGAQCIQESKKIAGQPITLYCDENTWVYREVVDALRVMAAIPNQRLIMTRFGEDIAVTFRHDGDTPAVDGKMVRYRAIPPKAKDHILLTLRLITI